MKEIVIIEMRRIRRFVDEIMVLGKMEGGVSFRGNGLAFSGDFFVKTGGRGVGFRFWLSVSK